MSEELTLAKMVVVDPNRPIRLPEKFVEILGKKNAVFVLSKANNEARLIPTDSTEVVKVSIKINKLSQKFLKELGTVIVRNKIDFLYTTGLCRKGKICFYEGYIDKSHLSSNIETFKKEIEEIEGVLSVDISTVS
ncbi:MAG: hypothetical protein ACTSWP_05860 [Candidatus Freyarchaeota archaeon]|nr:hypothetical protein [Candidatus Freyrarchaeum guaymaensis]